jgi:threonine dehydrogenase-like Zn-dependent dehydrogenase/predicted dehydrogenase
MKQVVIKKGKVITENVEKPGLGKNEILVKVAYSCISAGTEISGIKSSGKSIVQRVLDKPEVIKKTFDIFKSEGFVNTISKVKNQIGETLPVGYSAAGVISALGENIKNFKIGDVIACAGAGFANHAEYVTVPENLVVKIPANVDVKAASSVAIGAIAMHGVRRASLNFGEFCIVFGAGILGLLSIQMLKLAGVRVIAIDIDDNRLEIAKKYGVEAVINPLNEDPVKVVENITGGYGADAVIFSAATNSSEPLSQSFNMCKKKGKVVLVGVVGMNINRADMYTKELELILSTSYGPGRYDNDYELKGIEYPYSYIRWSENRNMQEYLRLISAKQISLDDLIYKTFPVEQAPVAYETFNQEIKPLMVMLEYPTSKEKQADEPDPARNIKIVSSLQTKRKILNVVVVGAGGFASNVHIPNLTKLKDKYNIFSIIDKDGLKAKTTAEKFGIKNQISSFEEALCSNLVDVMLICTRHDSHANLSLKSLQSGKNVLVEKPLAISDEDLNPIKVFFKENHKKDIPLLMVGYNRRFSKYIEEVKKYTDKRINPLFINYRMNAGFIPYDHWVHEDGGRIVGEACHIIDLMTSLTNSKIESISFESLTPTNTKFKESDNKSFILKYIDGSVCSIQYFATGSKSFPKEYMEVHFDGNTIVLNDYKEIKSYGIKISEIKSIQSDKGHLEELIEFHNAIVVQGMEYPIHIWDLFQTSEISYIIK